MLHTLLRMILTNAMISHPRRAALIIAASGFLLAIAACTPGNPTGSSGRGVQPMDDAAQTAPPSVNEPTDVSAPQPTPGTSLVIHPLTRVGKDSAGDPALILHLELRDSFNQSTKGPGIVRVELDAPVPRAWTIDLRDAAQNALMFDDLVTRTYTIPLGGISDALVSWSKGDRDNAESAGTAPKLLVRWSLVDASGRAVGRELKAEERLRR